MRKGFDPGMFKYRVEILRDVPTKSKSNAVKHEYTHFNFAWCSIEELKADRKNDDDAMQSQAEVRFVTRYRTDLLETDKLVWQNTEYDTLRFRMLGNLERLEIMATRRGRRNPDAG